MLVMPSVDILKGKCVRLTEGKVGSECVFFEDPLQAALLWENEGADALHIVDLDGALGTGNNLEHVKRIIENVSIDVEVGGGIRTFDAAVELYAIGAERVIVGSLAIKEPDTVRRLVEEIGGEHVMVALDYVGEEVVISGWTERSMKNVYEMAREIEDIGVKWVLATSVRRDGTLKGADVDTISKLVKGTRLKVVASGGIRSISDIVALKKVGSSGVVVGKALYMGLFSLKDAKRAARDC